jgi:hypothetical protein
LVTGNTVPEHKLMSILEAAHWAPSAFMPDMFELTGSLVQSTGTRLLAWISGLAVLHGAVYFCQNTLQNVPSVKCFLLFGDPPANVFFEKVNPRAVNFNAKGFFCEITKLFHVRNRCTNASSNRVANKRKEV